MVVLDIVQLGSFSDYLLVNFLCASFGQGLLTENFKNFIILQPGNFISQFMNTDEITFLEIIAAWHRLKVVVVAGFFFSFFF